MKADARLELALLLLEGYVKMFPAFRSKPIGAPFSPERLKQDAHIELQDKARAFLVEVRS